MSNIHLNSGIYKFKATFIAENMDSKYFWNLAQKKEN